MAKKIMRLYLTRQGNGLYMLSLFKPLKARMIGSQPERTDVYVRPGDPVGFRNICPWFAETVWGPLDLQPGSSTTVEIPKSQ